jgi:hypothetical protein
MSNIKIINNKWIIGYTFQLIYSFTVFYSTLSFRTVTAVVCVGILNNMKVIEEKRGKTRTQQMLTETEHG